MLRADNFAVYSTSLGVHFVISLAHTPLSTHIHVTNLPETELQALILKILFFHEYEKLK